MTATAEPVAEAPATTVTTTAPPPPECAGCQAGFTPLRWRHNCRRCKGVFCTNCLDHAVTPSEDSPAALAARNQKQELTPVVMCKPCFQTESILDFSTAVDVQGPANGTAPCAVFVHGGGGCRMMFKDLAATFVEKGFRTLCLDLPGHGARMDDPLTIDTAIATICADTRQHCHNFTNAQGVEVKPVYIGGSLGGYIGMELLGREPDLFGSAIISMAGQCVGVGSSTSAKIGMFMMDAVMGSVNAKLLTSGMGAAIDKNGHIPKDAQEKLCYRVGWFFGQGRKQLEIMYGSDPMLTLPKFKGPVLFVDGGNDHHDSNDRWRAASPNEHSRTLVYAGADHFFSHDSRFSAQFAEDTVQFAKDPIASAQIANAAANVVGDRLAAAKAEAI